MLKILLILAGLALLALGMATTPWQDVDGNTGKPTHAVTHYEDGTVLEGGTWVCVRGELCDS